LFTIVLLPVAFLSHKHLLLDDSNWILFCNLYVMFEVHYA